MALFSLLLVVIFILLGIYTAAYFAFHISSARSKRKKDLTTDHQATHARLMELDSLRSRNLISDAEHEEQRQQILQEFVSRTSQR